MFPLWKVYLTTEPSSEFRNVKQKCIQRGERWGRGLCGVESGEERENEVRGGGVGVGVGVDPPPDSYPISHPLDRLCSRGFPGGADRKKSACNAGDPGSIPWVRKSFWRRKWQSTPVFLPREFLGQTSLAGYSP